MLNKFMRQKFLLYLCRSRSPGSDSGLSMLEVLVAMMVVFLTFMTSLNGLLYATLFQVKAERQAQATYWIQQDLESVKAAAASSTVVPPDPTKCNKTSFADSHAGVFLNALNGTTYTATTPAPKTQTLRLYLNTADFNATPKKYSFAYDIANPDPLKYTEVSTNVGQRRVQVFPSTKTFLGKEYRMARLVDTYNSTPATFTVSGTTFNNPSSPQLLSFNYRVGIPTSDSNDTDWIQNDATGNTSILATLYTEVMPAAAISCP